MLRALLDAVADAARSKGLIKFRVDYKRNARGALVIALIIDTDGTPLARAD